MTGRAAYEQQWVVRLESQMLILIGSGAVVDDERGADRQARRQDFPESIPIKIQFLELNCSHATNSSASIAELLKTDYLEGSKPCRRHQRFSLEVANAPTGIVCGND